MIGTNLGLSLPLLSDNLATIVSKTSAALSSIQTSIADRATPAGLNITTALSFGGNWATNVGGLILVTGNPPSAAGSVYYGSDGEFYMVDHTGAVKMTLNGAINVSGFGGIGGDYGGTNPALLSYDTASGQYRFYTNGGTHAFGDTSARAMILNITGGSVKQTVDASVVTNKVYAWGNLGTNLAVTFDGTKIVTNNTVASDWHVQDLFHSTAWQLDVPLYPSGPTQIAFSVGSVTTDDVITSGTGGDTWRSMPLSSLGIKVGDTVTGLHATIQKATAAAALVKFRKKNLNSAAADISSFDTANFGTGIVNGTWTPFTPFTIASGDRTWIEMALAGATDSIINLYIFVTR